jgi:ubiquinone/menaquinone biosynthesis C-methylase UbiE
VSEVERIRERYRRRKEAEVSARYDALDPAVYMSSQEKQRALIRWIRKCDIAPLDDTRLFEVGCGTGDDLLGFIQLGFRPKNLTAYELLEERMRIARGRLPAGVTLKCGDAAEVDLEDESFDVVYQSTVFTSLLDASFQERVAGRMWDLAKPGGGILWCDFIYSNPRNPDVRGVPLSRIQQLFPKGAMRSWRIGLAPPISRVVTRVHPALYALANSFPLLRTHVLCWIEKS